MATDKRPLPKPTAANNKLIAKTPYAKLTPRQKQYASQNNVKLQPKPAAPTQTPAPAKGGWMDHPGSVSGDPGAPVEQTPTAAPKVDPQDKNGNGIPDWYDAQLENQKKLDAEAKGKRVRDAHATLKTVLADYGLDSLSDTVMTWLQDDLSEAEIMQEMRKTPTFTTRFPGIEERRKKGLAPISPGEYVSYERNARQLLRAAGLPQGFYDTNEDFTKFLTNDVSLSELGDRVTLAANAAFKMPKEARDELGRWGMGPGDITAFWLDPDVAQPVLERRYAAAQLSGSAVRTGFGGLAETQANDLVGLGVTGQEAEQGFGQLVQSKELFQSLDSGENVIGQDEQIGARFGGNANAQRRVEQRRRRRVGAFESGGGFETGQRGISGLGSAPQT